ncbi:hypothetical protein ACF0H5_000487 [Mactra antiquata]
MWHFSFYISIHAGVSIPVQPVYAREAIKRLCLYWILVPELAGLQNLIKSYLNDHKINKQLSPLTLMECIKHCKHILRLCTSSPNYTTLTSTVYPSTRNQQLPLQKKIDIKY